MLTLTGDFADRATARKFLAAANFLELLSVFGDSGTEVSLSFSCLPREGTVDSLLGIAQNRDKIKYSKWKAADIAKAFREGRTPQPGPAGGLPETEDPAVQVNQVTSAEEKELTKEFEALVATKEEEKPESARTESEPSSSYPFPLQPTSLPRAPSPSAPPSEPVDDAAAEEAQEEEDPSRIQTPALPTFIDTGDETSSSATPDAESTLSTSSIDHQPFVIDANAHLPASHQTASLPTPSFHPPSEPPAFPSAVFPPPTAAPAPSAPPPRASDTTTTAGRGGGGAVTELDPLEIAKVQKHARWAISALNYEDLETARKELRAALSMLGG